MLGTKDIKIFSKIQTRKGLQNIDEIIEVSNGIIIARGCIALSIGPENSEYVQKHIIKKCRIAGKPVHLLSHIYESLASSYNPTIPETIGALANVMQGVDGFILSN